MLPIAWIFCCLVCFMININLGQANYETMIAEENTVLMLKCPPGHREYISRSWYRGHLNGSQSWDRHNILYNQIRSGVVYDNGARADMLLDPDTFVLTIGKVQLEDEGFFSCRVSDNVIVRDFYHRVEINVHITPRIMFDKATYTENENETISCTIERLYPAIQPEAFTMKWGNDTSTSTGTPNGDKSLRYEVQMTKVLTREDDGMILTCAVHPALGQNVSESKVLIVNYKPVGSPRLLVDNQNPYLEDFVTFICNRGTIQSNPTVSLVKWYKNNKHLTNWPNNVFSNIIKITTKDNGSYSCYLGNKLGFSSASNSVVMNTESTVRPKGSIPVAVGGTIGGVVLIISIVTIAVVCIRRHQNENKLKERSSKHYGEDAFNAYTNQASTAAVEGYEDITGTGETASDPDTATGYMSMDSRGPIAPEDEYVNVTPTNEPSEPKPGSATGHLRIDSKSRAALKDEYECVTPTDELRQVSFEKHQYENVQGQSAHQELYENV